MSSQHPASVPAPWVNKSETYWFFLPTPATLPEASYAPLERKSFGASPGAGAFRGGFGNAIVQVVRYTDSPAGPYDELLYIPGAFDAPNGKSHLRITRIYVSTDISIFNGRRNWGIPKHMARFAFTRLKPECQSSPVKIEVFPPSPEGAPAFFAAIVTPSAWLPGFPMNIKYLPMDLSLVQPPLPALEDNAYSVVGTDQWLSVLPALSGKAEFVWYTPGGEGDDGVRRGEYTDGVGFPRFRPRTLGIYIRDATLHFPEAEAVEDKKMR